MQARVCSGVRPPLDLIVFQSEFEHSDDIASDASTEKEELILLHPKIADRYRQESSA
jgi:hypothetical protein